MLLAALGPAAAAHDPLFLTDGQTTPEAGPLLPDGTISFALYGRLGGGGDTRGFQVEFGGGDPLLVEVLIPDLPPENELEVAALPAAVVTAPDGTTVELTPDRREPFAEPFTGTSYLTLRRVEGEAQAGRYDVVVSGAAPARFTIAVGTTERFLTPVDRVENRSAAFAGQLRAWYDTPPGGGGRPAPVLAAVVALLAGAALAAIVAGGRRRRRRAAG